MCTPEAKLPIGGLILAGGRSSRFGREKAVAEIHGEPLIASVSRVLSAGCTTVAISARQGSAAAHFAIANAMPCLKDAPGDLDGPIAGVKVGLLWAMSQGYGWLVTAPCDAPFLPHDLVARLCAGGQERGAMACTAAGMEPLCTLWPVTALEALSDLREHPAILEVLKRLGATCVGFDDASAFANLNTPEDYARAKLRSG